jgi:hypothetical protein
MTLHCDDIHGQELKLRHGTLVFSGYYDQGEVKFIGKGHGRFPSSGLLLFVVCSGSQLVCFYEL